MSTVIQRSFSGGELSPSLYARADISKYTNGLRQIRNFTVMRHGGATNRAGTKYIGNNKYDNKNIRLIPFQFSDEQTYVLEFGDLYMRVIKNGVYIQDSSYVIDSVTSAAECQIEIIGSSYTTGDKVTINSMPEIIELNGREVELELVSGNFYKIIDLYGAYIDSTGFDSYLVNADVTESYELVTTYIEADLQNLHYVQSADVLTIAHHNYPPADLSRIADDNWTLTDRSFEPAQQPITLASVGGTAGANSFKYHITAVNEDNYEESLAYVKTETNLLDPSVTDPHTITWLTVSDAVEYNVYLEINGVPGLIGISQTNAFVNNGITPDTTDTPPIFNDPFPSAGNYPATVMYYQQRLMFANTTNNPEKIWTSRTGKFTNFTFSSPIKSDDAISFTLAGRQVNAVRSMIDLGTLVVLTTGGEWIVSGDGSGVLTPTDINAKQQSYNGSKNLIPVIIDNNSFYVQARGTIIRDLAYNFDSDGYRGNDLTIFSAHLFDDFSIVDWTFQQVPHSILWVVRSDGSLLGLTYIREHQMLAWHRHDFEGGIAENVTSVAEGSEDVLYVTVKRTINGVEKRYVERLATRKIEDVIDNKFLDSFLTYDGRVNESATNSLVLSGGTNWTFDELLTLTSTVDSIFTADDIGNEYHLVDSLGDSLRCRIEAFTSATVVSVRAHKDIPVTYQGTSITTWAKAVDEVAGLWHLEGKEVSVFADRFVAANPNNASYVVVTVADGKVTLDKPYGVIHIGLPYISDIETLNLDIPGGETLVDKAKLAEHLSIYVEETRGIWAGPKPPTDDDTDPLEGLTEAKVRGSEFYDDPISLETGVIEVNILPEWTDHGRVFVRSIDPIPVSVLAVAPAGAYPIT